ncbi:MAG: penicillin-binding protein 2 [Myxococcales bacterium]|nr:MAG: penicillin-binding protein 2 [Myxococcales bacterium]
MALLGQRSDVGEFRRRYRWLVLAAVAAFLVLMGRLAQLQLLQGDVHRLQARKNIIRERSLATTRGVIRDNQGRVLAANRPSYNVHMTPAEVDLTETWPTVVKLLGIEEPEKSELEKKIKDIQALPSKNLTPQEERRKNQQILLKVDVDRDAVAYLETHTRELKGVEVSPQPVRYYPYGELGAHSIGYMREVGAEDLVKLEERGYRAGDRLGAVGVERRWESYLRGVRGFKKIVRGVSRRDDVQEVEARYLEEPRRVEPIPGRDISLTLDVDLISSIDKAFRGQLAGAVVIVDVRTGRILAMSSKPSFDANVVSGGNGVKAVAETFRRLNADPLKPSLDKAISAAYPPGSTYKPFSALAALSDRLIDQDTEVDCRGGYEYGKRFFRCTGVHRKVHLHSAIVQSCNTYFYELGSRVSIDRLAAVGIEYGFGVKTGIGINPEARGRMPTRSWYTRRYKEAFRGGFTLLSAIGQGATTVTVLQLTLAYAALANGGTLYQPQVVRSIETSDGTVVQDFPPRVRRLIEPNQEHLAWVKDGLEGVVIEKEGTAYKERSRDVDMAGKTGTAQVSHVTPRGVDPGKIWYFNRDHAWFSGYAPSRSPEIAIVVLVEHGGGGGKNAVPIAMRVVRDWQKLKEKRLSSKDDADPGAGKPN